MIFFIIVNKMDGINGLRQINKSISTEKTLCDLQTSTKELQASVAKLQADVLILENLAKTSAQQGDVAVFKQLEIVSESVAAPLREMLRARQILPST